MATGQILRYLDTIASGATIQDLVNETSEKLATLRRRKTTKLTGRPAEPAVWVKRERAYVVDSTARFKRSFACMPQADSSER